MTLAALVLAVWAAAAEPREDFRAGRFDQAARSYRAAFERSRSPRDLAAVARSLLRDRKAAEAHAAATRAVSIAPDDAATQTAYGETLFRRAEFDAAERAFRRAAALDAQHASAWLGLARVLAARGLERSAAEAVEAAYAVASGEPEVLIAWAALQDNPARHLAALERAEAILDDDTEADLNVREHIAVDRALGVRRARELTSAYSAQTVVLHPVHGSGGALRGWTVGVSFDRAPPLKLLVDTGASGILLNKKPARKLRLERLGEAGATIRGIGDDKHDSGSSALASEVAIAGLRWRNYPLTISSRRSQESVDGVIGTDVFSDFLIRFDVHRGQLRLEPYAGLAAPPDPNELRDRTPRPGFLPVWNVSGDLLVEARLNGKRNGLLLIDTGANANLLHSDFARAVATLRPETRTSVRGVSGSVGRVFRAAAVDIDLDRLRLTGRDVIAFDMTRLSDDIGVELSGILGIASLSAFELEIDYRDNLVRLNAAPPR